MMGILRTILFAATGLAATGAAFAQQTDSASLFRTQREHASPVAALDTWKCFCSRFSSTRFESASFSTSRMRNLSWV